MIRFFGVHADDPSTTVNSSSIGDGRWEGLWRCVDRVAVCVEGWDLSVSLSGILTALALVCTQTSYMNVSLFTAPRLTLLPRYTSIISAGPHAHT